MLRSLFLHRYAVVTAVATLFLLIAGSLVTSTDSGLAVPDWPLSYGMWFPPMVGGILYEHGHRMIAAVVGLMILGLALWTGRTEPRRWVRWLSYTALAGVIVQALLGGLTVLLLLPPAVSIAHACLGQAVFCLVVALAWRTSSHWIEIPPRIEIGAGRSLLMLGYVVALLSALQLTLGAVIRHTGTSVSAHVTGAILLAASAWWLAWRLAQGHDRLGDCFAHATRLAGLMLCQLLLGLLVLAHRDAIGLRTGHVAVGALVLAQSVVLAWELSRRIVPAATRATHIVTEIVR